MVQAICQTLIHSLWQGLLFAILSGLVMTATRRSAAAMRYNMLCGLFFLFLFGCICTFFWECSAQEHRVMGLYYALPFATKTILSVAAVNDYFSAHASLIVTLWFIILSAKCIRMWASLTYIQKMKRHGTSTPPACWTDKLNSFCEEWGINRPVLLLESGITKIPVVIGHLRPVIFVPMGLLTGLPQAEIEAVLWHELAHIRRGDYLVNFLQNIAESLFFFNPGLLWMSSILREERENCCDDMAIAQTKDSAQFVRALISFREHAARNRHAAYPPVCATAFATKKNKLLRRAMRIVYKENSALNPAEKIFLFVSCFFLAFLLFVAPAAKPFKLETIPDTVHPVQAIVARPVAVPGTNTSPMEETAPVAPAKPGRAGPVAETVQIIGKEEGIQVGKEQIQIGKEPVQIEKEQEQIAKEQALTRKKQAEQNEDAQLAAMDKDRMQAMQDAKQAVMDKIRAEKDRLQAMKDAKMAEKDKAQADMRQQQAARDL